MQQAEFSIIYLHGFQSSSLSEKANALAGYLQKKYDTVTFYTPDLPFSPELTINKVEQLLATLPSKKVLLIGSSMGGFYAANLSIKYALPAVLINPATKPSHLFSGLLHKSIQNKYTGEQYFFTEQDFEFLQKIEQSEVPVDNSIFCLIETGDQVLDYRLAVERFKTCQLKIIEGGDHRFQNFEACLPEIMQFFFDSYQSF